MKILGIRIAVSYTEKNQLALSRILDKRYQKSLSKKNKIFGKLTRTHTRQSAVESTLRQVAGNPNTVRMQKQFQRWPLGGTSIKSWAVKIYRLIKNIFKK